MADRDVELTVRNVHVLLAQRLQDVAATVCVRLMNAR